MNISLIERNRESRYIKQVNPFHKTTIGKPKKWLIEAAADIGLDYSGLSHEVTNHFKDHVIKKHGIGALAITEKDFEKIPEIIRNPDLAIIGIKRKGRIRNVYAKRESGQTYLYYDEMLSSNHNKALRGCTLFKVVKSLDMENLERIVIMNEKTDLSSAKKIIAAGGHPGGEV